MPLSGLEAWTVPLEFPALGEADAHVWRVHVPAFAAREADCLALLDGDERARAGRFRFAADRQRFVASHATVRALLARYAGAEPATLGFRTNDAGKPFLSGDTAFAVEFNLAHSGDVALIAVTRRTPVGVDIERCTSGIDPRTLDETARGAFSAYELAALRGLPAAEQTLAFFAIWTRKEAYLKATGAGITNGLGHFDVSHSASGPARLLADRSDSTAVQRWSMVGLSPGQGYSAALVTDVCVRHIGLFDVHATMLTGHPSRTQ